MRVEESTGLFHFWDHCTFVLVSQVTPKHPIQTCYKAISQREHSSSFDVLLFLLDDGPSDDFFNTDVIVCLG
jgi:hypothetical protein